MNVSHAISYIRIYTYRMYLVLLLRLSDIYRDTVYEYSKYVYGVLFVRITSFTALLLTSTLLYSKYDDSKSVRCKIKYEQVWPVAVSGVCDVITVFAITYLFIKVKSRNPWSCVVYMYHVHILVLYTIESVSVIYVRQCDRMLCVCSVVLIFKLRYT